MTNNMYACGVNLGGWISQYHTFDERHFETFIQEADIARIAGWRMDHVRLPVDYPVIESDDHPFEYRENGFAYIDRCLSWCQAHGLGLVLDLHKAPGYSFTDTLEAGNANRNTLFSGGPVQERFIALWETITRRYLNTQNRLAFEFLNEVVLPDSGPWNDLAAKTLAAVRAIDPSRTVIIGGNRYNAASELKNVAILSDPNVIYTFHFYEPLLFTHQKAGWVADAVRYNQVLDYPGPFTGLDRFLAAYPEFGPSYAWLVGETMDRVMLRKFLQPAFEFITETGKPLYCGEFGVIDNAPVESQINWLADFTSLLKEAGIGMAVWSYKGMNFGLVNLEGQVVNQDVLQAVVCR